MTVRPLAPVPGKHSRLRQPGAPQREPRLVRSHSVQDNQELVLQLLQTEDVLPWQRDFVNGVAAVSGSVADGA